MRLALAALAIALLGASIVTLLILGLVLLLGADR